MTYGDEAIQFLQPDMIEEHVKGWTCCFLRVKIKNYSVKNSISMKILRLVALYEICVFSADSRAEPDF